MSMTEQSYLYRWAMALWRAFQTLWHASGVGEWFHRRKLDFAAAAPDSVACRVAVRQGGLRRAWEDSLVCRGLSALFNLPVTLLRALFCAARRVFDGSLALRGVAAVGNAGWLLTGGFVLLMLIAPHERWDNLYAFLGACAIFALYAVGCATRGKRLEVGRLGPYFALYVVLITLGLVLSLSPALSLRFYLFHMTCFLLVLVTVSAVENERQLNVMLVCAAVGLTVAALYGCYQGYVGVEVVASQQDLTLNEGMPGRIYGFFDNPNNFAEVLVMLTPLVGALTLNARSARGRLGGALALAISLVALGMTYSRSSWLGLALAAVIFLALMDWRFIPGLLVLGVCAIPFLPQSIWNRILTIGNMDDTSAKYRIAIWEDTARLLGDYPLTGVGLGSDVMKRVFQHYPTLYDGNYPIHTHNNYLQMWGETGLFGLLALLGVMLGQIKEGLAALGRADLRLRRILAAALGALGGILAIGLVEYTWFYPRNLFLFWFLFATIASAVKLARQEAK